MSFHFAYDKGDMPWATAGRCVGFSQLFFGPELERKKERIAREREAKAMCNNNGGCAVLQACLDHAMTHDEFGVWGGMTEQERRKERVTEKPVVKPLVTMQQIMRPVILAAASEVPRAS